MCVFIYLCIIYIYICVSIYLLNIYIYIYVCVSTCLFIIYVYIKMYTYSTHKNDMFSILCLYNV